MVDRSNFRAFDPATRGEMSVENERRFRAAVEAAFNNNDNAIALLNQIIAGSIVVPEAAHALIADLADLARATDYVIGHPNGNRVINGNFRIYQRGVFDTTLSPSGTTYQADRWKTELSGSGGAQLRVTRENFTTGTRLGMNEPRFYKRLRTFGLVGQPASHYAFTRQFIEFVETYAGETITVLFWAQAIADGAPMSVVAVQNFGTGGSPSPQVVTTPTKLALTTEWVPYAVTFDIPSLAGKTRGTNGDDSLAIEFWISAGSDWNSRTDSLGVRSSQDIRLWGIHILPGAHTADEALNYLERSAAQEFEECQRFYETGTFLMQSAAAGAHAHSVQMLRQKRITPTVATQITSSTSWGTLAPQGFSPTSLRFNAIATASGGFGFVNWQADAEF